MGGRLGSGLSCQTWWQSDRACQVLYQVIAALFVETGGAYFGVPGVDPWDALRDARTYAGPNPVVAHPPCNKWTSLAYINRRRIPGYEIGDDGGCFAAALAAVERWGGVLEHPAGSIAWKRFGLDHPERGFWKGLFGSWVTEVDQGAYGHRARKRTWLYVNGGTVPPPLDWTPAPKGKAISGFTHQEKGNHVGCEHLRIRPQIGRASCRERV